MKATPVCSCPIDTCNDPPCDVHGFPKCADCGEDVHDFVSCETVRQINARADARRATTSAQPTPDGKETP